MKCWDSTNPDDIPVDAEMVLGYCDGLYRWSDAGWARFPSAVKVRVAVSPSTNDGEVGDCETGDMTPQTLAQWARMRIASGLARPTGYVNLGNWGAARQACQGLPMDWWVADYDNNPTIPQGAIAKQYANQPLTGGHYDWSSVLDTWRPSGGFFMGLTDAEQADLYQKVKAIFGDVELIKTQIAIYDGTGATIGNEVAQVLASQKKGGGTFNVTGSLKLGQ